MTDRTSADGWVLRMTRPRKNPSTQKTGGALMPLRRFLKDRRGVAAIEFGMIMPVMVTLWLGTTELTFGSAADRRVAVAASSVADLVARQRSLNDKLIEGIFKGAQAIVYPDGQGADLEMIVTAVKIDADGKATVDEAGGGHNRPRLAKGTPYPLDGNLIDPGLPGCAIVATVQLKQEVMFLTEVFDTSRTLSHTFAYRPRAGGECPKML